MSLILATGSNLGDSLSTLKEAQKRLSKSFQLLASSNIYRSAAVDYEAQPDFFNQVLEFKLPHVDPKIVMEHLLDIERAMGRERTTWRGPRSIDIDLVFWGLEKINTDLLTVPHPRWAERSFIVRPLRELPFFQTIKKCFTIPESFKIEAFPVD
jgi:2-amino-4-hydroxy-6-hydroxymethyldihydropteridine diphosphokinase